MSTQEKLRVIYHALLQVLPHDHANELAGAMAMYDGFDPIEVWVDGVIRARVIPRGADGWVLDTTTAPRIREILLDVMTHMT